MTDQALAPTALLRLDTRPVCYIDWELKTVEFTTEADDDRSVSVREHSGYAQTFLLPTLVDASRLSETLAEMQPVLDQAFEAFGIHYDGQRHVGSLGDEAFEIEARIRAIIDDAPELQGDYAGVCDAADWLDGVGRAGTRAEYGIEWDTTDDQLEAIAQEIEEDGLSDNAVIVGTYEYLESLRQDAIEEAASGEFDPDDLTIVNVYEPEPEYRDGWPNALCDAAGSDSLYAPDFDGTTDGHEGINILVPVIDAARWIETAREMGWYAEIAAYPIEAGRYGDGGWDGVELVSDGVSLYWIER